MTHKSGPDWRRLPESIRNHPEFLHHRIDMVEHRISHIIPDWVQSVLQWAMTFLGFLISLYPQYFIGFLGRLFH